MTKVEVDIINPKADRLLRDLADMNLISIRDISVKPVSKPSKKAKGKALVKVNAGFLKYLSSWPVMTDKEAKEIEEKRKHLNKWK
jgi:hypothetical protein